jgi:hypothetical protein
MQSTKPLRVLPGGFSSNDEKPSLTARFASPLIGVATIKTIQEDPQITAKLVKAHKSFEYLAGHTVGIVATKDDVYDVDWPRINKRQIWTTGMSTSLFSRFELASEEDVFKDPDAIQEELQELCLRADRVAAISSSLADWKHAVKPGVDRFALLIWLASSAGHNRCEVCEKTILRHVFDDAECRHIGPVRQRCHDHVEK